MARQVQLRRGTTAEHSTFTGANGETTVDTDKNVVVVHDGSTVGGFPAIKAGDIGSSVLAYDANLQSFIDAFTLPTVDGTNGQFLKTDGAGALSFADVTPPSDAEITLAAGTGLTGGGVFTTDQSTNETITFNAAQDIATTATPTFAGSTMTGAVTLPADPTSALQAATKSYVDTIAAAGLHYHEPVRVEKEGNLNATYDNGTSGVGATLTNAGTQEALVIDGVTLSTSDRVLVYNQADAAQNGIYTVTDVGSASTNWVLTRATDADSYGASDPDALGQGDAFFVLEGTAGAGELYVMNTEGTITFGTTNITFVQISSAQIYVGTTGVSIDGNEISIGQSVGTTDNVTFNNISSTGNITVTGTVDGRDVATDGTKLDGIEAGAEVNTVDSVNTQTGAVVLDADDISDAATTNKFTTAGDISKLAGIEAGADVTDTANVTAAGALMDSEVTNLAQVKAFNSADYATAAQGTLADSAVQPNDSPTFVTANVSTVDFGDWTITESGGSLYFATGGTNKMKLDASGNLDVVGNVNSNATIT